MKVDLFIE